MSAPSISAIPSAPSRSLDLFGRVRRLPLNLLIGSFIVAIYFFVALTARFWAPYDYAAVQTGPPFAPPSWHNLFGTDQLGRDLFSRVVLATDKDLFTSLASTLIAMILGGAIGLVSGLIGGWLDELLMRIFELTISIPILIFALLVITAAGPEASGSIILMVFVVVIVYLPRIARMARSVAVDLVTRDFITVARARGESPWSIVWRELAPNATGVLFVEFGVRAGWAPILIGSLGFLGFGIQPPTPEWGVMISENRAVIMSSPAAVFAPGLALAFLVIGLNLFTDGLARALGRTVQRGPV